MPFANCVTICIKKACEKPPERRFFYKIKFKIGAGVRSLFYALLIV